MPFLLFVYPPYGFDLAIVFPQVTISTPVYPPLLSTGQVSCRDRTS